MFGSTPVTFGWTGVIFGVGLGSGWGTIDGAKGAGSDPGSPQPASPMDIATRTIPARISLVMMILPPT
jgi:hypothetical protein